MDVHVGQRFKLLQHIGYQPDLDPGRVVEGIPIEDVLNRHHPLFEGQIGEIVAIIPAEVDGAGTKDEDHAVLKYEHRNLVNHELGKEVPEHEPGGYVRFHSARDVDLADRSLYEPLDDNPDPKDYGPPPAAVPWSEELQAELDAAEAKRAEEQRLDEEAVAAARAARGGNS